MSSKLIVRHLSSQVSEKDELEEIFSDYGSVKSVQIMIDRDTGRRRGFAFVEMGSVQEAQSAVEGLDDSELKSGRCIRVDIAQDRGSRGSRRRLPT